MRSSVYILATSVLCFLSIFVCSKKEKVCIKKEDVELSNSDDYILQDGAIILIIDKDGFIFGKGLTIQEAYNSFFMEIHKMGGILKCGYSNREDLLLNMQCVEAIVKDPNIKTDSKYEIINKIDGYLIKN